MLYIQSYESYIVLYTYIYIFGRYSFPLRFRVDHNEKEECLAGDAALGLAGGACTWRPASQAPFKDILYICYMIYDIYIHYIILYCIVLYCIAWYGIWYMVYGI